MTYGKISKKQQEILDYIKSEILNRVNRLGIGPENMGGTVTALAVNIISYPTHVSTLPVAVNLGCHVTRHATEVI